MNRKSDSFEEHSMQAAELEQRQEGEKNLGMISGLKPQSDTGGTRRPGSSFGLRFKFSKEATEGFK